MEKYSFIKTAKELLSDSSFHGIPRIIKTRTVIMKVVWSFLTLVAVCFCVNGIMNTTFDYLSFKTISAFETIVELPSLFPAITVCNLNPFQTLYGANLVKTLMQFTEGKNFNDLEKRLIIMRFSHSMNYSAKRSLSLNLKDTLVTCRFNSKDCTWTDFEWYFDFFYGNCYRFNNDKNKPKTISQTGNAFGLHLELFVPNSELNPDFIPKSGYQIMIKNQSDSSSINEGYEVAPGFETNFEISRHFSYKLSRPYSDCLKESESFDSKFYREIINLNKSYQQSDCFFLCLNQLASQSCNSLINSSLNFNTNLSYNTDLLAFSKCYFNYSTYWLNNNFQAMCSQFCPIECSRQAYSVATSFSKFPMLKYAADKMNNLNARFGGYDFLKNSNFLAVNIYYKDLTYSIIREEPKTGIFDLISNIGGLLGLFVGMSLLSLGEILEILFEMIASPFLNSKSKRNRISVRN